MTATRSIGARRAYWITEQGRRAIVEPTCCECEIRIDGLLWVCRRCDTIYAKFEQMRGMS